MSKYLIYVDTKNEKKIARIYSKSKSKNNLFSFHHLRVILKYINTENATQCAYKLVLPFVDLETSLVPKDFVEIKSSSMFGSSLDFDFCFAISEYN